MTKPSPLFAAPARLVSRWAPAIRAVGRCALIPLAVSALAAQQPITLRQAIDLAERQGNAARAATSERENSRDLDHAFFDGYLPSFSINGSTPNYSRLITPVIQPDGSTLYLPIAETDANLLATVTQRVPWTNSTLTVSSGLAETQVSGINGFHTWSSTPWEIGISQPILRSNSQAWDIRQQHLSIEASERSYLETREDIALNTTNAFFDLYSAGANVKNAESNVAINDTLYTLNKGRLEIGKIGENDLLQSELALLRSRASLSDAKLTYERALSQFRLTLNLPTNAPVDLQVTAVVPVFDADTTAAVQWARLNSSASTNIVASEVAADRNVSQARWNSGVGGTINASYGYNATAATYSGVYNNLLNAQQFSLSVQMPIWQWGAHSSTVDAARANRDAVRDNALNTRAQLDLNAHFAALQLTQSRLGLEIGVKADTVAGKRYEVAYNRYVIGRITIDNLYIAQSEKDAAVQAYADALRAYWNAYYTLRRLTLYDFERNQPIRELDGPAALDP